MSTTLPDAPTARPTPRPAGRHPVAVLLRPLASLQLTVALMALSVGLVFFGTVAQKYAGIWNVVDRYFWSFYVMVDVNHLLDVVKTFAGEPLDWLFGQFGSRFTDVRAQSWAKFPWPGGKVIGGLMFVNLLVAQFTRLRLTWKRSGVYLLHSGLVLLFVGEFVTREFQVEQSMTINEGESVGFTVDTRNFELAVVDPSGADDRVTVIPAKLLQRSIGGRITHPDLPVDLEVLRYDTNSRPVRATELTDNPATAGQGRRVGVKPAAEVPGVDMANERDIAAAYIKLLKKGTDESLGVYLFSLWVDDEPVMIDGKPYRIGLRNMHYYKPYTVKLHKFRFDRYPGTETPKNFSSQVTVSDPERGQEFETTIAMNEPLRHRGETLYQADFDKKFERTTILQVVRNPGWLLPYVACGVVSVGMLLHFAIALTGFLRRSVGRRTVQTAAEASPRRLVLPVMTLLIAGLLVVGAAMPRAPTSGKLDLSAVARLPVQDGGRIKPLDTVARVDLRVITHKEEFSDKNASGSAIRWLFDAAVGRDGPTTPAAKYGIFRIENDQVLSLLHLKRREGLRYSWEEIEPRRRELVLAGQKANEKSEKEQDIFDKAVIELGRHIHTFEQMWRGITPDLLPPTSPGGKWRSPGKLLLLARDKSVPLVRETMKAEGIPADIQQLDAAQKKRVMEIFDEVTAKLDADLAKDPAYAGWTAVLDAYRANDPVRFNAAVSAFAELGDQALTPGDRARVRLETVLNHTALFYHCTWLYVLAGLAGLTGWLCVLVAPGAAEPLRRVSVWMLVATLVVHTATLLARMYLMDRPLVFVTNLYSTAVFIGWGAVVIGLVVERVLPLGVGAVMAATVGFATTILAHNLAASGDTLEMMRAVLDTNFWLATHVTTINLGYSASYLAGAVGLTYVVLGLLPAHMGLDKPVTVGAGASARRMPLGKAVGQALYGVVCLATLLSFVGTVLGGIWGDQSWGRFWGWDPKENGALLIVLWNALILHARWCGLVKERGMALLALAGNMIVTWSYFGTNQLGVGLHAYGFSKDLANVCLGMWVFHAGAIGVGLVPWLRTKGDG